MKTITQLTSFLAVLLVGITAAAAADKKIEAGPKGGRLLERTEPRAEFHIGKDRRVTIAFYDAKLKPVPVTDQRATVIADAKGGKTALEFEKKRDELVSKTALPEGDGYNLVVQLRQTADAKPQNFRFKLDLSTCGGCQRVEYACSCHE